MKKHRLILLLLVLAGTLFGPPIATANEGTRYYVSLGDSLAAGPGEGGEDRWDDYPAQLLTSLRKGAPNLKLMRWGCGGETTGSMISGDMPWEHRGERFTCSYPHGSQLADAVHFLQVHRGFVSLVTIDIGGNDVVFCLIEFDQACLSEGIAEINQNLPLILSTLRAAAGPDVPIVGMNYYSPFLALWFASPALAVTANQMMVGQLNPALEAAYANAGEPFADVEAAFSTTDWTLEGGIPRNVLRICEWTLMCAPPPLGPDFHPNAAGYGVIAQAFHDELD
jgi:lysophospholipase L1-like esterase